MVYNNNPYKVKVQFCFMGLDGVRLGKDLLKFLGGIEDWKNALDLIRNNSEGECYLFGGAVYRSLNHLVHRVSYEELKDYDFLVENRNVDLDASSRWRIEYNRFGNPKFVSKGKNVDMVPFGEIVVIRERGLEPCLDNFLVTSPYNLAAMVLDLSSGEVIGSDGLKSLEEKSLSVLDRDSLEMMAKMYNSEPMKILDAKAKELGFEVGVV